MLRTLGCRTTKKRTPLTHGWGPTRTPRFPNERSRSPGQARPRCWPSGRNQAPIRDNPLARRPIMALPCRFHRCRRNGEAAAPDIHRAGQAPASEAQADLSDPQPLPDLPGGFMEDAVSPFADVQLTELPATGQRVPPHACRDLGGAGRLTSRSSRRAIPRCALRPIIYKPGRTRTTRCSAAPVD